MNWYIMWLKQPLRTAENTRHEQSAEKIVGDAKRGKTCNQRLGQKRRLVNAMACNWRDC